MTRPIATTAEHLLPERAHRLLEERRDRAERQLNRLRIGVLALLALAAAAYAPALPRALTALNALVLGPVLAWAVLQAVVFRGRERLPAPLALVNPVVDITAVTAILAGYGLAETPALALKSPMFLAYFAVLAARPIASSTRIAAMASALALAEYLALLALLAARGGLVLAASPIAASAGVGVALLDEGAKVVFLAVGGAIAVYATRWQEDMALAYYRETHDREEAEVRLAQARFEALRRQLQPHFLFNALNTVTSLIVADPRGAERMVARLSELLRASLQDGDAPEVPLRRELEVLQPYLDIQQIRFADRLTIRVDAPRETHPALVPTLLLQPLVENAIRHGLAPRASAGRVLVRARRDACWLRLEVEDDGVGPRTDAGGPVREGVGIGNTRSRLRHLYGDRQRFECGARAGGGFRALIEIPFALAGGEDTPPAPERDERREDGRDQRSDEHAAAAHPGRR